MAPQQSPPPQFLGWRHKEGGAAALIFLATLLAYLPAMRGAFLWNDSDYVTQPALRSLRGLWRIWFDIGATQQYYPLLHSAFWVEHGLWGDAPLGYHLANILLHATSACLFGLILSRLRVPGAFFAALIFALHPVCVESVAWISEQKNTLSTVFYLLAALTYLRWIEAGPGGLLDREQSRGSTEAADGRAARPCLYLGASLLFIAALLSKSVTATLPAALLVVIWWKRGRLSWKQDVIPLIPWFGLGAAAGLFTGWVERQFVGAQGSDFALSFAQRFLVAGRAVWFYLGKLLWPAKLIFIYPRWQVNASVWWQYLFPLSLLVLLAILWARRRRSRGPLAALLLFIGSLFPTLGFFNVYAFIFSFVADHFQYLAALGIIAAVAAGFGKMDAAARRFRLKLDVRLPRIAAFAVICLLGALTFRQCEAYRDVPTFYRTILKENPDCWMAHYNFGLTEVQAGRIDDAIAQFEETLRIRPDYFEAHNNLGLVLADTGRLEEAIVHHQTALRLSPDSAPLHNNLGNDLADLGRLQEAIAQYKEALRLKPDFPEAQYDLGNALGQSGEVSEAIAHFQEALRLKPDYAEAHSNLGVALAGAGLPAEALAQFAEAVRLKPDYVDARLNLAAALKYEGRMTEARAQFEEAMRLKSNYHPRIHLNP